jgi:exosortase B
MSNSANTSISTRLPGLKAAMPEWWPILFGIVVLYVPTFYNLLNGLWATDEQAHGPIIFALAIWLIYRQWPLMMEKSGGNPSSIMGWLIIVIASLLYIIGRSQQVHIFEVGSLIWMMAGILLIKLGSIALKVMWFPLFFMLFMIPLPGTLVIMLTMPLKMAVSYVAEHILFWANYPVARNGVILQIGQYQLLIADACSGLQTLLTLEALGLFYLNVIRYASVFRNVTLAIFIVPISFSANVIRVISLSLITYYFGDAVGQGFFHWFAGMVLFLSALLLILTVDKLLRLIVKARSGNAGMASGINQ